MTNSREKAMSRMTIGIFVFIIALGASIGLYLSYRSSIASVSPMCAPLFSRASAYIDCINSGQADAHSLLKLIPWVFGIGVIISIFLLRSAQKMAVATISVKNPGISNSESTYQTASNIETPIVHSGLHQDPTHNNRGSLEEDLQNAGRMFSAGLIDEEEFKIIKRKIIDKQ